MFGNTCTLSICKFFDVVKHHYEGYVLPCSSATTVLHKAMISQAQLKSLARPYLQALPEPKRQLEIPFPK